MHLHGRREIIMHFPSFHLENNMQFHTSHIEIINNIHIIHFHGRQKIESNSQLPHKMLYIFMDGRSDTRAGERADMADGPTAAAAGRQLCKALNGINVVAVNAILVLHVGNS